MKNFLQTLLPLDRLISLALRFGFLARPLEYAAKAYRSAQGIRTQASLGLAAAIGLGAILGYIPWDTARPLITALVGAAAPTFLEKLVRAMPYIERGSEAVKNAAETPQPPASKPSE